MAEMTGVEDLVERVYSMSMASPVSAALQKRSSIAQALIRKTGVDRFQYSYLTLVERVTRILRRIGTLQVTPMTERQLITGYSPEALQVEAPRQMSAPTEPISVRATGQSASIDGIIRRMIRRLRFRRKPVGTEKTGSVGEVTVVKDVVTEEPRPRPQVGRLPMPVPQYKEKIVAALPPLTSHPTAEPDASVGPVVEQASEERHVAQLTSEEWLASSGAVLKQPAAVRKSLSVPWKPTSKFIQTREAGKRVAGLAASMSAAPQTSLQANLVETVVETRSRIGEAIVNNMPGANLGAAIGWSPIVVGTFGSPSSSGMGAGLASLTSSALRASSPLQLIGETVAEKIGDLSKDIVDREVESRSASTASQVSRLSKRMAERIAQVYRRGIVERLPPHERVAAGDLAPTPAVGGGRSMKIGAMAEMMAGIESVAARVEERRSEQPSTRAMLELTLMGAQIASASGEAQSIASQGLREITGAVPRLVSKVAAAAGLVPISTTPEGVSAAPGVDLSGILARMTTTSVDAEAAISESINQMATALKVGPMGTQQMERVVFETPPPVPGMRLHEVLPALSGEMRQRQTEPPPARERPRPTYERPRPIEVKVDTRSEDIDLRELERKIARILREEARRYGVY